MSDLRSRRLLRGLVLIWPERKKNGGNGCLFLVAGIVANSLIKKEKLKFYNRALFACAVLFSALNSAVFFNLLSF